MFPSWQVLGWTFSYEGGERQEALTKNGGEYPDILTANQDLEGCESLKKWQIDLLFQLDHFIVNSTNLRSVSYYFCWRKMHELPTHFA